MLQEAWRVKGADARQVLSAEQVRRFYEDVIPSWSRRKWLDIAMLTAGDRTLAVQLQATVGTTLWVVVMAYDPSLSRFSPGRILFAKVLRDSHDRGTRLVELGGEGHHWKQEWTNRRSQTIQVELPLGGWKSRVWSLANRLHQRADPNWRKSVGDNVTVAPDIGE